MSFLFFLWLLQPSQPYSIVIWSLTVIQYCTILSSLFIVPPSANTFNAMPPLIRLNAERLRKKRNLEKKELSLNPQQSSPLINPWPSCFVAFVGRFPPCLFGKEIVLPSHHSILRLHLIPCWGLSKTCHEMSPYHIMNVPLVHTPGGPLIHLHSASFAKCLFQIHPISLVSSSWLIANHNSPCSAMISKISPVTYVRYRNPPDCRERSILNS